MKLEELMEIDERFKGWTDWKPHLLDDADGGRYIEVYKCPGCVTKFVTGNNDEEHEKVRLWAVGEKSGYEEGEVELLGIFDKVEKREVTPTPAS